MPLPLVPTLFPLCPDSDEVDLDEADRFKSIPFPLSREFDREWLLRVVLLSGVFGDPPTLLPDLLEELLPDREFLPRPKLRSCPMALVPGLPSLSSLAHLAAGVFLACDDELDPPKKWCSV